MLNMPNDTQTPIYLPLPKHTPACNDAPGGGTYAGIFTDGCPLCALIRKVIMLRRRSMINGATYNESTSARGLADALISKYRMPKALYRDAQLESKLYKPLPSDHETRKRFASREA